MDDSDAPTEVALGNNNRRRRSGGETAALSCLTTDRLGDEDFTTGVITLCDRKSQIETIKAAYKRSSRGRSEVLLVSGRSGTGKTSLVEYMRQAVTFTAGGGHFVAGKFDQQQTTKEAYSAIAGAFSDLCDLILQSEPHQQRLWREAIIASLGQEGCKTLSGLVSSLSKITGDLEGVTECQPKVPAHREDGLSQIKLVSSQFLRAVATEGHPLLLFLDDFQSADDLSVQLVQSLLSDNDSHHILLCIAYQDDEVDCRALLNLNSPNTQEHFPCTTIEVEDLDQDALFSMLSQLLHSDKDPLGPLADLVYAKTKGNPKSVVQLLQFLKIKRLVSFSDDTYSWHWNMNVIESEVSDNSDELLAERLELLDATVIETLKLAAYMGNLFSVEVLERFVVEDPQIFKEIPAAPAIHQIVSVKDNLNAAADMGLIEGDSGDMYRFCHESIRSYLYKNCAKLESDHAAISLRIGRRLLKLMTDDPGIYNRDKRFLLVAASNLMRGADLITDKTERLDAIRLFLDAAIEASGADAKTYLEWGMRLRRDHDWNTTPELSLALQSAYAEALCSAGCFSEAEAAVGVALRHAKTTEDILRAQCIKLRSLISSKNYAPALEWAREVLEGCGEKIRTEPSNSSLLRELCNTKIALRRMHPQDYLALPQMEDPKKCGASKVLDMLGPILFTYKHRLLFVYCCLRHIRIITKHGLSPFSSSAIAGYAVLVAAMGRVDDAYHLGKVAVEISTRPECSFSSRCLTLMCNAMYFQPWRKELKSMASPLIQGFETLTEKSRGEDLLRAFTGMQASFDLQIQTGKPLAKLEKEMKRYSRLADEIMFWAAPYLKIPWQYVQNLMGKSDDPLELTGEAMNLTEHLESAQELGDVMVLTITSMYQLRLQLGFEQWDAAKETLPLFVKGFDDIRGHYNYILCTAEVALVSTILFEKTKEKKYRRLARKYMKRVRRWANSDVPSAKPLWSLVNAEWTVVTKRGGWEEAAALFDEAIEGFATRDLVVFETLACQRAMHVMASHRNDIRSAHHYLTKAIERHREWGSIAKAEWLEVTYRGLLKSLKPAFIVEVTHDVLDVNSEFDYNFA